ncbi:MAG: hypothetical protein CMI31_15015 [Opitutae bacterium]|nr:hypothetical protein [Opitutae bacterium]|tara:strand:- start:248 stop:889 length:642 start_codon:yes stop_codon:yes gene_type:complete
MIAKIIALFRNRASSPEEATLEDALRSEATRLQKNNVSDEVAVAKIMERAKCASGHRKDPLLKSEVSFRKLLAGATLCAAILLVLKFGNQNEDAGSASKEPVERNPADETLFAQPVDTLTKPFASLAFNPLEPATEEWNRFTANTIEKAESLFASAKVWSALPTPNLSINPDALLPEIPDLPPFSPYGDELRRLRNDARNAVEALPFFHKING